MKNKILPSLFILIILLFSCTDQYQYTIELYNDTESTIILKSLDVEVSDVFDQNTQDSFVIEPAYNYFIDVEDKSVNKIDYDFTNIFGDSIFVQYEDSSEVLHTVENKMMLSKSLLDSSSYQKGIEEIDYGFYDNLDTYTTYRYIFTEADIVEAKNKGK